MLRGQSVADTDINANATLYYSARHGKLGGDQPRGLGNPAGRRPLPGVSSDDGLYD